MVSFKVEELFLDESEEIRKEFVELMGDPVGKIFLKGLKDGIGSEAIANVGPPVVPILILFLNDKSEKIRDGAVKILREIGTPAVDPLIQVLNSESQLVRYSAAQALGQIGDRDAAESLIQALKDENSNCRRIVAWALGQLKDKRGVKPLIQIIKEDNVDVVRTVAVMALGEIGDAKSSAETLIQAMNDKSKDVRKAAKKALDQLKEIKRFYSTIR